VYSSKHLKLKLQERYGEHIYFAEIRGRKNVVCFRDLCSFIISNEWLSQQTKNDDSDKVHFVKSAAKIILAEVREMQCDMDSYPNIECEDSYQSSFLPPLLQTFLSYVTSNPLKRSALGQCLIQAARPRTMLAPLLLGLAVQLDHVYGSSSLITELSRFGFCLSYDEVTRYKQCVVMSQVPGCPGTSPYPAAMTQWVGDNIDHNLQTLDGKGTFHGMGLISVSVPLKGNYTSSPIRPPNVRRLKSKLPVSQLITNRGIPIVHYNKPGRCGLVDISMKEINQLTQLASVPLPPISHLDMVWHLKWFFRSDESPRPNWSGYMQATCTGEHKAAGAVNMLPMVDLKPTDASCIYSTLLFVVQQAKHLQVPAAVITFDQPLWMKAVDIAAATGLDIVCRLGGFHIIKSYLGAIGSVMAGSGLEELLGTVYGPDTVVAMMNGNAVSRAVRGHLLVQGALVVKLVQTILDSDQLLDDIHKCIADIDARKVDSSDSSVLDDDALKQIEAALSDMKTKMSAESRTAKLWTRYIDYVQLLKLFLLAERTSNWYLHLKCIHDMLNVFAATGHNNYYKSCRLYLQLMLNLPNSHPQLHEMFASGGLHSVRRTEGRYWGGLSMDLIIEQCLMKSIKGQGGLTRGRGMSETVRAVWVATMHQEAAVHLALSTVTGLHHRDQQHVDLGHSRAARDCSDTQQLLDWLDSNDPFHMPDGKLYSLSSGVVADEAVTCDTAEEIGAAISKRVDGAKFYEITLKRSDQIKSIARLHQLGANLHNKPPKNETNLFYRLLIQVERSLDIRDYFSYELTSEPTALFSNSFMRKPDKPAILRHVLKNQDAEDVPTKFLFVLDGGALLHRVRWVKGSRFLDVLQQYATYIGNKYGQHPTVVFDGYGHGPTTKDHEHQRRSTKVVSRCPDVSFDTQTPVVFEQHAFLANDRNKDRFIQLLMLHLDHHGCRTLQSDGDADVDIVKEALSLASTKQAPVAVVGDDTDLLVLLIHHWTQDSAEIWFCSEAKKRATDSAQPIRICTLQRKLGNRGCRQLLAVHAFGGCDTTSAVFGHGKLTILKRITAMKGSTTQTDIMHKLHVSQDEVAEAGHRLMVSIYGGSAQDNLNNMRYNSYCTSAASSRAELKPQKLPPTERAVYFHSLRAHLQTVVWKYLRTGDLDPLQWGWHLENGQLCPTMTDINAAPESLANIIRCKCRTTCTTMMCSCRKQGHTCFSACEHCHGKTCSNVSTVPAAGDEDSKWSEADDIFYDSDVDWLLEETVATVNDTLEEVSKIVKAMDIFLHC